MWNIHFRPEITTSVESTTGKYKEFITQEFIPKQNGKDVTGFHPGHEAPTCPFKYGASSDLSHRAYQN